MLLLVGGILVAPNNSHAANAEGLYSGSFSGAQNGKWFLLVEGSGNGQVYFWIAAGQVVDTGKVSINGSNKFTFKCTYGVSGNGEIGADGKISGDWKYEGVEGKLTGTRQDLSPIKSRTGSHTIDGKGNEACRWIFNVAPDGSIKGNVTWEKNGLTEEGSGAVNSDGDFIFLTQDDTSVYGTIDSSGEISGEWNNPFWETKGVLGDAPLNVKQNSNPVKAVAADDTPQMPVYVESEEENGCFIRTLGPSF